MKKFFLYSNKLQSLADIMQFSTLSAYEDSPLDLKSVKNLNKLKKIVGTEKIVKSKQVHSDKVLLVNNKNLALTDKIEADALITRLQNIGLMVLTADCVPISLYDPQSKSVGIIHAGWKGTKLNINRKTVDKMKEVFKSDPKKILAVIGPSAGPCCYEVSEEMIKEFRFSYGKNCINKNKLDLWEINKQQLLNLGVLEGNIEIQKICTICDKRFFSYRRQGEKAGRFGTIIALKEKTAKS
jgi:polyphenol oxidase